MSVVKKYIYSMFPEITFYLYNNTMWCLLNKGNEENVDMKKRIEIKYCDTNLEDI